MASSEPLSEDSIARLLRDIEALDLHDIDPEALRAAEFQESQAMLDGLVGQCIAKAHIEENRIAIETQNGNRYFFFGFMGSGPQK